MFQFKITSDLLYRAKRAAMIAAFCLCMPCINACSQTPVVEHSSLPSSLYVDSVRGFSFCPLADDSSVSHVQICEPIRGMYTGLEVMDGQLTRDEIAQRVINTMQQAGLTIGIDSNFSFRGKDAFLCEYHGKINGMDVGFFQFNVATGDKIYTMMMPYRRADSLRCDTLFQNSIWSLNFEGAAPEPQNSPRKSLFSDSFRKFNVALPDKGQFVNDSLESIVGFAADSITTTVAVTHTQTSRKQWRQSQEESMKQQEAIFISDSSLTLNGKQATLTTYESVPPRPNMKVSLLSIIDKQKVYTIMVLGPSDRFSKDETAIRNSLMTFKLF